MPKKTQVVKNAKDIYRRKPESVTNDISILVDGYYPHINELTLSNLDCEQMSLLTKMNKRIVIKIHKDISFDGRRIWRLAAVFFNGKPVMIIQNAGREGDDHSKRFITNVALYKKMTVYLLTLAYSIVKDEYINATIISEDEDNPELYTFYDRNLNHSDWRLNCY